MKKEEEQKHIPIPIPIKFNNQEEKDLWSKIMIKSCPIILELMEKRIVPEKPIIFRNAILNADRVIDQYRRRLK